GCSIRAWTGTITRAASEMSVPIKIANSYSFNFSFRYSADSAASGSGTTCPAVRTTSQSIKRPLPFQLYSAPMSPFGRQPMATFLVRVHVAEEFRGLRRVAGHVVGVHLARE